MKVLFSLLLIIVYQCHYRLSFSFFFFFSCVYYSNSVFVFLIVYSSIYYSISPFIASFVAPLSINYFQRYFAQELDCTTCAWLDTMAVVGQMVEAAEHRSLVGQANAFRRTSRVARAVFAFIWQRKPFGGFVRIGGYFSVPGDFDSVWFRPFLCLALNTYFRRPIEWYKFLQNRDSQKFTVEITYCRNKELSKSHRTSDFARPVCWHPTLHVWYKKQKMNV